MIHGLHCMTSGSVAVRRQPVQSDFLFR